MEKNRQWLILPLRSILFIMIFLIASLVTKLKVQEISKYWTVIVVCCNFITITALLYYCNKRKTTYLELIDFKKPKIKNVLLIGIIIAVIDALGAYIFDLIFGNVANQSTELMMQALPIWIVILDLLLLPITSTIAEEGLYLGVGINKAKNIYFAIFFYALQHCFFPMIWDIKYIFYRFIVFMPSIIFMCVYYKRKKDITPIMFEHFVVNLITIIQIMTLSI